MGQLIGRLCDCNKQRDSINSIEMHKNSFILQYQQDNKDQDNENHASQFQSASFIPHSSKQEEIKPLKINYKIDINLSDFKRLKVLGKGSFGKVILVQLQTNGEYYAMKILKKKEIVIRDQIENALREKEILQLNHNPFLVKLKFAFQDTNNIYLIMEYIQGGELFFHLKKKKKFSEKTVVFYSAQIALALSYLHSELNTIYRDLKPENILLDKDGNIKLTDFGLASKKSNDVLSFCGTPEFLAPEIISNEPYSIEVDYWTLGCCVYEMLCGYPPFRSSSRKELYQLILMNMPKFPHNLSPAALSLLHGLLQTDPSKRFTIDQIKQHDFYKEVKWKEMSERKYQAPIVPTIETPADTRNFDTPVNCSVNPTPTMGKITPQNQLYFDNFTYKGDFMGKIEEQEVRQLNQLGNQVS